MARRLALTSLIVILTASACATLGMGGGSSSNAFVSQRQRIALLRRSQVWTASDVASKNLRTGPDGPGSFQTGETVTCNYNNKQLHGKSPKFWCVIGELAAGEKLSDSPNIKDQFKVKYGYENAEVYGEVVSTRLLWALGFGADRMYPVRVICHGCPADLGAGTRMPNGDTLLDPAVIERKMDGREIVSRPNEGWSWTELNLVDPEAGGAPRAHRDALKLLAVFMQHGDNKADQQVLLCTDKPLPPNERDCAHPYMLISDPGLTFGRADFINRNVKSGAHFARWSEASVWKDPEGCVGNLPKTITGTLGNPEISEEGRNFLADLLMKLRDAQIRDLFEVARVEIRPAATDKPDESANAAAAQWVGAFKAKRAEITNRTCQAAKAS